MPDPTVIEKPFPATPSANGTPPIIKIGDAGLKTFQFTDAGQPVVLDVTRVWNQLVAAADKYRGPDGKVPSDKLDAYYQDGIAVMATVLNVHADAINYTQFLQFDSMVKEEADKLRVFFDPGLRAGRT
jgi:hypothetical protein